jgi:toxin-antitoxin system PIN domain toxin
VILVDVNVLVYAAHAQTPYHSSAARWLQHALNGNEALGFAWSVLLGFLRISTLRVAFPKPLDAEKALDAVDDWLAAPTAIIVHPTTQHASILRSLLRETGTAGNLVADAHLTALALEHRARICSFDRDFLRFSGVRAFVPTA